MKILLVADLHYTLKQWDWLSQSVGGFDLVVIAGDMLDIVSIVDIDVQILVVMKYLRRMAPRAKLIMSSGNHDGNARNEAGESVARWMGRAGELGILIDGDSYEEDGMLFTICPWWDGEQTKGEVGALLERDAARAEGLKRWIWIYHAPPNESPVGWDGKRDFGDAALREWIECYQPWMVLAGHIHHAPFAKDGSWVDRLGATWVFNGGRQIGPVPTHVVIDTVAQRADWLSLAGPESVDLETGLAPVTG